jgi:cyanophycin synthetase
MPHRRRKIVYTAAGDRRDEDIIRQAQIIGDFFHDIYIYEDQCTRGRPDGEIMRIMREGFGPEKPGRAILQEVGELGAISAVLASLKPGDLLLCQVDQVELALDHVMEIVRQSDAHIPGVHAPKSKATVVAQNAAAG